MQEKEVAEAQRKANELVGTDDNPVQWTLARALALAPLQLRALWRRRMATAALAGISVINKIREIQEDKANKEHASDGTAQKTARLILKHFYSTYGDA